MIKNTTLYQEAGEHNQNCNNVAMIGAGYVGLVTGTCLAALGHKVYCFDIEQEKINQLQLSKVYIHEPGLSKLIIEQTKLKRLIFTNDLQLAVNNAEVIFIAVGTPQEASGKANLNFVEIAISKIAALLEPSIYKLIVIKSTVPAGTCRQMQLKILQINPEAYFDVASNPEFLREGSAVLDFMQPERIIIGLDKYKKNLYGSKACILLQQIYQKFITENIPVLFYDLESSELIKYAANCFLAVKVSFINELADFCEQLNKNLNSNVDILMVAHAMGLDSRIGEKFLQPGPGIGGSCFPKDTLALDYCATQQGVNLTILHAAITANQNRINNLSKKIVNICKKTTVGVIVKKTIAILGIAFKANTDDIRDSAAIKVINDLHDNGAKLQIYDPQAMQGGKIWFKSLNNIIWANNAYKAVTNADVIIILTEWPEFAKLDLTKIRQLMNKKHNVIIDFRNLFSLENMESQGFDYYSVGR